MATLKRHRQRWQAKVRIPVNMRDRYDGREFLYKHLSTPDKRIALAEATAWEADLRLQWLAQDTGATSRSTLRTLYSNLRDQAAAGLFQVEMADADPVETGIEFEIERLSDDVEDRPLPPETEVRLAALQDAKTIRQGKPAPRRPSLEPSMRETADIYLSAWRTQHGLKETNTEQQKVATFDLFSGYFGSKPLRDVTKASAAHFVDALRQMHPDWARKPQSKTMTWDELQRAYGGQRRGLSDATVNRHMGTLQTLWDWAVDRDHASGPNPFKGFRRKLKEGVNRHKYAAWEPDELRALFNPPPKRKDMEEVMRFGLYSGMRLDEIVSLTLGQCHFDGPIPFVRIIDAKTPAGNRDVPVHPELGWLLERVTAAKAAGNDSGGRVWPSFNSEGPSKKPGADAGREFSRFKAAKGFTDRRKVFHSFRKNFVGQLELLRVPETEVAQIVGHEKRGITFGTYGTKMSLQRKYEIISQVLFNVNHESNCDS